MYNSSTENQLIIHDIDYTMQDYVSIQLDIDNTKVKAAALVAQNIDIKRLIGKVNLERCINQTEASSAADQELKALIVPALCYFTFARCLRMFQGTFTDSGFILQDEGAGVNTAKSVANEMKSIAEAYMQTVIEFLEDEDPNTEADKDKLSPRIRVFGGEENRASN